MSLISRLVLQKTGTIVEKFLHNKNLTKIIYLSDKSPVRQKYGIVRFESIFNGKGCLAYLEDDVPVNAKKYINYINKLTKNKDM